MKKFKIKVDKNYTAGCDVKKTIDRIECFNGYMFTFGDLVRMYFEEFPDDKAENFCCGMNVIDYEAFAFPAGYYYGDKTCVSFDMILAGFDKFAKIHISFHVDDDDVSIYSGCHRKPELFTKIY